MSYAPNPTGHEPRSRAPAAGATSASGHGRGSNGAASRSKQSAAKSRSTKPAARGRPFEEAKNWKQLGMLAGGIAAGAAIGASVALLFTSKTGPQRRAGFARRARYIGHDVEQRWDDLGFALKEAARAARDRFRHRHAADDETEVDD